MAKTTKTNRAVNRLARVYLELHPGEASRHLEGAPVEETADLLGAEPTARAVRLMRRLTPDTAGRVLERIPPPEAGRLLSALEPNRAAALLSRLDHGPREERLAVLDERAAGEIRALMVYPPDSAGHLMDPRVTTFPPDTRAGEAIRRLKALQRRGVQDVFLVGEDDRLLGAVGVPEMALAPAAATLASLAQTSPPAVGALAPRDEVLEILERSRGRSLPVVDLDGRILGVLRQEELIHAAEEAASDNLVTMVGAGKDERALSPPLFAVRKRLPWLEINLVTAFLAASVVGIFEDTIARFTALAVLLPVVAGQSGNTGAQALAVTMRGLALREVRLRHWMRVTGKEVLVGLLNGVAVALTTGAAVYVWSRSAGLAAVICISMVISMTVAGLAGATIPMFLTRIGQDPAQSSSIILTTVTDVVGFFSFLGIATLLASTL